MRKTILLILFLLTASFIWADQITKIAVIDYNRVLSLYYGETRDFREYDEYEQSVLEEVESIRDEIRDMEDQLLEERSEGNEIQVLNLEKKIQERKRYLADFIQIKKSQLVEMRQALVSELGVVDEFIDAVQFIAETNGFSIVFRKDDPSLLWYAFDVDITDKVIAYMTQNN